MMSQQLNPKRWITADEYEQMGIAGIFPPDDRLELLEGEIYEMSPIGSPHAGCVRYLTAKLVEVVGNEQLVSVQCPLRLSEYSEPEPDIALLRWRDDYYREKHPTPDDTLLLIEVADTSLPTYRRLKLPLYGKAGIPEVWIVDLNNGTVELNSDPVDGVYRVTQVFRRDEIVESRTVANVSITVNDIFGLN